MNAISIATALMLFIFTFLAAYIFIYLLFLRKKRAKTTKLLPENKKGQITPPKCEKTAKTDYGYCALNEIVGYDIVLTKDISVKTSPVVPEIEENKEPKFSDAKGIGMSTVRLGTTGSDGYVVNDDPVPDPEELERRRRKEKELKRIEEENRKAEKIRQEEERKKAEMERTFIDDSEEPDMDQIRRSIQDFYDINPGWSEIPYEEYTAKLGLLEPSSEDINNQDNHSDVSLEELKKIYEETVITPEEELEYEEQLIQAENS